MASETILEWWLELKDRTVSNEGRCKGSQASQDLTVLSLGAIDGGTLHSLGP